MRRLANRTIGIDQGTAALFSDFETGGAMWTGSGPREVRVTVRFSAAFAALPAVQLSLAMLDADRRTNQRFDLAAETVTKKGFQIVFRTWGDSRIARARAAWTAVGELPGDDDWDVA